VFVGLYKILAFHFKALLWESIILLLPPPPTCKAYPSVIRLHDHCAIHTSPRTPPLYAIHHTILAMAISCKGQRVCCIPRRWLQWTSSVPKLSTQAPPALVVVKYPLLTWG